MHSAPNRTNILFIGGLHRSGTSMVHRILRRHPEISGFCGTGVPEDEGQHLQSILPTARAFGGAGRFCFNPDARMDETHPMCDEPHARRLLGQWRPHWDGSKEILVEKSPPNLIRTRFLQGLFPEARFLIILRHPIAVAYATRKFIRKKKPKIDQLIRHSLAGYRIFAHDLPHLKRATVIRYEDFVEDPSQVLEPIYASLGIPPVDCTESIRQNVNREYLEQWTGERKSILRACLLKRPAMDAQMEQQIRLLGYSPEDGSVSPSRPNLGELASFPV